MIAAVALLSWRQKLRLERDLAIAVGRSLAQMLLVGAALGLIVDADTWLGWSFVWVAGMVAFAAVTVSRRAPMLPGVLGVALIAMTASAVAGLGLLFALGIFPVAGRTVVPVAGMVLGNSLAAGVLTIRAAGRDDRRAPRRPRGAPGARPAVAARRPPHRPAGAAHRRSRPTSSGSRRWGSSCCRAR